MRTSYTFLDPSVVSIESSRSRTPPLLCLVRRRSAERVFP